MTWRRKSISLPKNSSQFCVDQSSKDDETIIVQMCESENFDCRGKLCIAKCNPIQYNVVLKNQRISKLVESKKSLHSVILDSTSARFDKIKPVIQNQPGKKDLKITCVIIILQNCFFRLYFGNQPWHL